MTISAWRTMLAMSLVREWQTVTVALRASKSNAAGMPTIFERPMTTAFAPSILTPACSSRYIHPYGVQGTNSGSRPFCARRPIFSGENPSTSFSI